MGALIGWMLVILLVLIGMWALERLLLDRYPGKVSGVMDHLNREDTH